MEHKDASMAPYAEIIQFRFTGLFSATGECACSTPAIFLRDVRDVRDVESPWGTNLNIKVIQP